MTETLKVEFEVEKTILRENNYQEKLLKFRGGDTRYKGIIKDDKLVAILGRNYKLITNEAVENAIVAISGKNGFRCGGKYEGWKIFDWVWSSNGRDGVMVANSVDGTIALRCIAIQNISTHTGILVSNKIQNIYRRHTKKAISTTEGLEEEICAVMLESRKYGEWLQRMGNLKAKENMETLKVLFDELPKEYTKGLDNMFTFKTFGEPTVKDVYECIAKKIWNADIKMTTRLIYYRVLNDVIFIIVGI